MPSSLDHPADARPARPGAGMFAPVAEQIAAYNRRHGHPSLRLERAIADRIRPDTHLLDIGCGRTAPLLAQFAGRAGRCSGVDLVDFAPDPAAAALSLAKTDVGDMRFLDDATVDLAYSRSVMEHLPDPDGALAEIARVLKPGGSYLFLTPNKWDYASIAARLVPNRWHPRLVRWVSGRPEEDTFPTHYRANTHPEIERLAARHGFEVVRFAFQGQYPAYLKFSRPLFWLGARYERLLQRIAPLRRFQGWIYCELRKAA